MGREFDITPRDVPRVDTKYRRIVSKLPHPESVPVLEALRTYEPTSMRGQPPVVWDRAEDVQVHDGYGNMWLDWSSGVLVTNAGHRSETAGATANARPRAIPTVRQGPGCSRTAGEIISCSCRPNLSKRLC